MTAAVPLLWHCMKVWSQPSTAPGPDKPKHCKGNIDPSSAVTLVGGCTVPAELILWSKDRHVMSSVQCYVHSHCTLATEDTPCSNLNFNVNNSSYLQGGHWTVDRWLHHTAACYRVNVIFHNELHSVSLCNVSGPVAGGGGVRCPTHCLWDPITITTSVRAAGHWAGLGTSLTTQVWSPTAAPPPPTTITTSKPSKLATRLILPKHLDIPYPFHFRT